MNMPATDYDVIIMGGAFSGSAAAMMLKRDHPDMRVLIVERTTHFDRKVGESTSEVAGCFLTRILHQSSHLSAKHYQKHGLRMWFCKTPQGFRGRPHRDRPALSVTPGDLSARPLDSRRASAQGGL